MIPRGEVGLIFAGIGAGLTLNGQPLPNETLPEAVVAFAGQLQHDAVAGRPVVFSRDVATARLVQVTAGRPVALHFSRQYGASRIIWSARLPTAVENICEGELNLRGDAAETTIVILPDQCAMTRER